MLMKKPGRKKTIMGLIYRPPSIKIDHFIARMNNTMSRLSTNHNLSQTDVVVLGDFNVNFTVTQNPMRTLLSTTMSDYGLRQTINRPMRVTNRSSSLIDLFFTNIQQALLNASGVIQVSISDHMPVYISKKAQRQKHPKKVIASRRYGGYTKEAFGKILLNNPGWKEFWSVRQDSNKLWLVFSEIVQASIDVLCPIRNIVLRVDQLPWIDKDLRKSIEAEDKQYVKAQLIKSKDECDVYRNLKSSVRKSFIAKKRRYILSKLDENRDEPRLFWKEMDRN